MTPAERKRAAAKAANAVQRGQTALTRDTRAEVVRQLREALAQITATLAGQPANAQDWRLTDLRREIERALREFGVDASAALAPAIDASWDNGGRMADAPLEAAGYRLQMAAPAVNVRALEAMRTFLTSKIRDVGTEAANRINTQLGLTMMGAQSPFDAVRAVHKILGEATRERATTIVHTELGRAFSAAHQARLQEIAARGIGVRKQWRRSGKLHSRPEHDALDGVMVEIDQPFISHSAKDGKVELMYPRDPKAPPGQTVNCGCTMLTVIEGLDYSVPVRKPFTPQELAASQFRRDLADAVPVRL